MAVSIAYGIIAATVLTLIILPVFISITNSIKVFFKWLFTGEDVSLEEVERAVIEIQSEHDSDQEA